MVLRLTTDLAAVATDRLSWATLVAVVDGGPGRVAWVCEGSGDLRVHVIKTNKSHVSDQIFTRLSPRSIEADLPALQPDANEGFIGRGG